MAYQLSEADRAALAWQMTEDPDAYVARIEANRPEDAAQVIAGKVTACKVRRAGSADKRTRIERDAAAAVAMEPTPLAVELMQARAFAQVQADLAAAKALGLAAAEQYLTDEATKLAPRE